MTVLFLRQSSDFYFKLKTARKLRREPTSIPTLHWQANEETVYGLVKEGRGKKNSVAKCGQTGAWNTS